MSEIDESNPDPNCSGSPMTSLIPDADEKPAESLDHNDKKLDAKDESKVLKRFTPKQRKVPAELVFDLRSMCVLCGSTLHQYEEDVVHCSRKACRR